MEPFYNQLCIESRHAQDVSHTETDEQKEIRSRTTELKCLILQQCFTRAKEEEFDATIDTFPYSPTVLKNVETWLSTEGFCFSVTPTKDDRYQIHISWG